MNDRFLECLEHVLRFEGGYVNNPADRGGPTSRGVTQRVYDDYRMRKGLGRMPVSGISGEEVQEIYFNGYWKLAQCDRFPQPVDMVVFDAAVNSGPGRAVKWVQQLVGAKPDGDFGPKTLASVSSYIGTHGSRNMARDLIGIREGFLDAIVDNDASQSVFKKGWDSRLAHLRDAVSEAA